MSEPHSIPLDCTVSLRVTLLQRRQNSLTLMPSFLTPGLTRPENGGKWQEVGHKVSFLTVITQIARVSP